VQILEIEQKTFQELTDHCLEIAIFTALEELTM